MKFYKLKALSVGAKGNRVLRKEDDKTYPENTWPEKRAEELVGLGFLTRVKEDPIKAEPKKKSEPKKDKPEAKKEAPPKSSILDDIIEAGGEKTEGAEKTKETATPEDDERKALLKEAKGLAKEKGIKAPHYLMGIKKLKTFINDNK